MGRSYAHEDLPASEDPVWAELGVEVLEHLSTPKTISQLKEWARARKLEIGRLINVLTWLDMRSAVAVERLGDEEAVWRRVEPPSAPPSRIQVPPRCPRCKGMWKAEPQRLACIACGHSIYPPALVETEEDRY
jgi:predicted Zn-ribbon and HTH transcriptional regulator